MRTGKDVSLYTKQAQTATATFLVLGIDQIGLGIIQLLRRGSKGVSYCWYFGYNTSAAGGNFIWYRWYYMGIIPLYNWYNWYNWQYGVSGTPEPLEGLVTHRGEP